MHHTKHAERARERMKSYASGGTVTGKAAEMEMRTMESEAARDKAPRMSVKDHAPTRKVTK